MRFLPTQWATQDIRLSTKTKRDAISHWLTCLLTLVYVCMCIIDIVNPALSDIYNYFLQRVQAIDYLLPVVTVASSFDTVSKYLSCHFLMRILPNYAYT